jgi:hypothetical protein
MRIYTPFAGYLTRELGMNVQFTPVVDDAATVEGLARDGAVVESGKVEAGALNHPQDRLPGRAGAWAGVTGAAPTPAGSGGRPAGAS